MHRRQPSRLSPDGYFMATASSPDIGASAVMSIDDGGELPRGWLGSGAVRGNQVLVEGKLE